MPIESDKILCLKCSLKNAHMWKKVLKTRLDKRMKCLKQGKSMFYPLLEDAWSGMEWMNTRMDSTIMNEQMNENEHSTMVNEQMVNEQMNENEHSTTENESTEYNDTNDACKTKDRHNEREEIKEWMREAQLVWVGKDCFTWKKVVSERTTGLDSILSREEALKTKKEILGNILIIEIGECIPEKKFKAIGDCFLHQYKAQHVSTIVRKCPGGHQGKFRIQKYEVIAGENSKDVFYRENGCKFKFHLEKVFFSKRMFSERERITKLVKHGERVACLFAGAGPFPIVIAKHSQPKSIDAVELNSDAFTFLQANVSLNKLESVITCHHADVLMHPLKGLYDRILMPAPRASFPVICKFIESILPLCEANRTIVHFYDHLHEDLITDRWNQINSAFSDSFSLINAGNEKAGSNGKKMYRVCYDFLVSK